MNEDRLSARLGRFIDGTSYDELPAEIIQAVKFALLDTIGVTVAGSATPTGRRVASVAKRYRGAADCTVIGTPMRTDPAWAALVNGTAGHALDYDDQSWAMGGHPSVVLFPTALALAEQRGLAGRDLIRAYALGFEAAAVVGRSVNPEHYGHGWHTTGTVGVIAATCAAAVLLGLEGLATRHAIAAGASAAAGLRQNFGSDLKPFHAGNAARSGVVAAELGAAGVEGDLAALDGRWGFCNVFMPGPEPNQFHPAGAELGKHWDLLDPGIATKLFPACGATHPAIGAMLELRAEGLLAEDVQRIDVRVVDMTARILEHPRPTTGLEAKFSMEYCVARALLSGTVALGHFEPESVTEPAVRALTERTVMRVDPQLTAEWVWATPRATIVEVTTTGGQLLSRRADLPPGSPGNFDATMLRAKFDDCVGSVRLAGSNDDIADCVGRLDECPDVRELTALIGAR